jgi:zeta-carotene desaturase
MNPPVPTTSRAIREVLVIGGGLSGMSAACALSQAGFRVRLLERRPYVGGRASSYDHPGTGETIDNCQHVLLGCCTNLANFYERIGVDRKIQWTNSITFIEPGGRRSVLRPGMLPAPMHSTMSFLSAPMLGAADKVSIARALNLLVAGPLKDQKWSFGDWLRAYKQSPAAIDRFWRPIVLSALNDEPDNVSVHYGSQVFHESMLKSAQAGFMGLSTVPLGELYERAITFLEDRRSSVHLRASVERVQYDVERARWHAVTLDESFDADAVVFALPYQGMQKLLPEVYGPADGAAVEKLSGQLAKFTPAPITGIHLWLDRIITDLPHAALLDSPIQWVFQKSRIQPEKRAATPGTYLELVVSHSVDLVSMSRQQVIDLAMRELPQYFPAMHGARILKSAVIKEVNATFRVPPGVDQYRPRSIGPWTRTFLAGDWTATHWPSTMEGAVRSGYLAAEALCSISGQPDRFLQPDLQETGLMRFLMREPARDPTYGYS